MPTNDDQLSADNRNRDQQNTEDRKKKFDFLSNFTAIKKKHLIADDLEKKIFKIFLSHSGHILTDYIKIFDSLIQKLGKEAEWKRDSDGKTYVYFYVSGGLIPPDYSTYSIRLYFTKENGEIKGIDFFGVKKSKG